MRRRTPRLTSTAADEQLKILGVDKDHPSPIVNVYAPITGVIVGQNVTNAAAAGVALSGSATAFTIADLSSVWVVCDVYENDIPKLQVGQEARIVLNAYPDRPLTGRVSDIGPVLDPSLRTAKVRIQVANPGFLKLGMFATATFTEPQQSNICGGSLQCDSPSARSRLGVCARRRKSFSADRGTRRKHA